MNTMGMGEVAIWAGMSGALALLCLIVVADWLVQRTVASARGLLFVVTMGAAAIMWSGFPEQLFSSLNTPGYLPVKLAVGPLSGALALRYLGGWLGSDRDDALIRRTVQVASVSMAVVCVLVLFGASELDAHYLLMWTSIVYLLAVSVAMFISARAAALGDSLARWMVFGCGFLWVAVTGLVAKSLSWPGLGLWVWGCTALATVAFFCIAIALTIQRTREVRRLRMLAKGLAKPGFNISMPQGSQLIPKVADVMWRSQRLERPCVVAAIAVRNLYELADDLGHGVEAEILSVLAARIRRHVGFRNVVGLYHPRCFVLAVSSGQDPRRGELLVSSLLKSIRNVVRVGPHDLRFDFWPVVGVGVVEVQHSPLDALQAIDAAEQLAIEDLEEDTDDLFARAPGSDPAPRSAHKRTFKSWR